MNCIKNGKYTGGSCFGCSVKVEDCEIRNKVYRNRWIPCSEILPEQNKDVQVTFRELMEWNEKYIYGICKAIYIDEHSVKAEDMRWDNDNDDMYDEFDDTYYVRKGLYEVVENWSEYTHLYINCEVTAWQPLPEPYKKEV